MRRNRACGTCSAVGADSASSSAAVGRQKSAMHCSSGGSPPLSSSTVDAVACACDMPDVCRVRCSWSRSRSNSPSRPRSAKSTTGSTSMRSPIRYPAAATCLQGCSSPQSHSVCSPSPGAGNKCRPTTAKHSSIDSGISPVSSRAAYTASPAIRSMTLSHSSRESGRTVIFATYGLTPRPCTAVSTSPGVTV